MASIFKSTTICYRDANGRKCTKDTPGAEKLRIISSVYYGRYQDSLGNRKTVRLVANKRDSETLLQKLATDARMDFAGLADPMAEHRARPLAAHLDDYERALLADNNTPRHARQTTQRARKVFTACKFRFARDVQASRVTEWLAGERKAGRLTIQTSNYYQRDAKSFFTWMVKDKRIEHNPLIHLSPLNAEVEGHKERRALDADEYRLLLDASQHGPVRRGLAGPDRFMLYLTASNTGIRPIELRHLCPDDFQLDGEDPTVTVPAAYSKHRREDRLPLRQDLAEMLRGYLDDKPAKKPIWPGSWWRHGAKMVKGDLEDARAKWLDKTKNDATEYRRRLESDYLAYVDHDGRTFDFYAQRGQMLTALEAAGVNLKTLQALARHSRVETTLKHYTRTPRLMDARAALDALPPLPTKPPGNEAAEMRATGTDGKPVRTQFVHILHPQASPCVVNERSGPRQRLRRRSTQPDGQTSDGDARRSMMKGEEKEAPPGFEPGIADLQSAADPHNPLENVRSDGRFVHGSYTELPDEIQKLADRWEELPGNIRRAIVALVDDACA